MACAISIVLALVGFIAMSTLPIGVDGMDYMVSKATSTGTATIDVYFKQGVDPDIATVNVQNRVSKAQSQLPSAVVNMGIETEKRQNSILRIIGVKCTNGKYNDDFVSNYVDINIKPRMQRIFGVGSVTSLGNTYALRVWMKPDVLAQYGLTPDDISTAINNQSFVTALGNFGEQSNNKYQYSMEYKGTLKEIEEFQDIVVKTTDGGHVLLLKEVADIEIGAKTYSFVSNISGQPGTFMLIFQSPGSNATEVNQRIDQICEEMKATMPDGLEFVTLMNADDFLFAAIHNVVETLIIAIILVILVVFFFLQNIKATVIPSISVVVSLMGTFMIVTLAGFSLNLLTLFALVLAIGTVVDDSIVVVEAVMAKIEGGITDAKEATRQAMNEVSMAVFSCTLVFMAVFIPVTFISGTSGTFFTQFGITIASAVGLSCLQALTTCPALCAIMLRVKEGKKEGEKKSLTYYTKLAYDASYNAILGKYTKAVQKFIKRPVMAVTLLVVAAALLVFFMMKLPSGLVPQEDQGMFMVEVDAPEGYTLQQTYDLLKQVEEKVKAIPEMESYSMVSGYGLISGQGTSYGFMVIRLKNWEERPGIEHCVDMVMYRFYMACSNIRNATIIPFQMPQIPGYGTSSNVNLVVEDPTDGDLSEFSKKTDNFLAKLMERPEVSMAMSTYSEKFPKYRVEVDPTQCSRAGLSAKDVLSTLGESTSSVRCISCGLPQPLSIASTPHRSTISS